MLYSHLINLVTQKYNSCLETLDLNKNPCSGPGLEGVSIPNSLTENGT